MKVTFISEVGIDGWTYKIGAAHDLPDDLATSLIATGWAVPYKAPPPKTVIKEPRKPEAKEKSA